MEYDRKADNNINIEIIFPLAHTLGQKLHDSFSYSILDDTWASVFE